MIAAESSQPVAADLVVAGGGMAAALPLPRGRSSPAWASRRAPTQAGSRDPGRSGLALGLVCGPRAAEAVCREAMGAAPSPA